MSLKTLVAVDVSLLVKHYSGADHLFELEPPHREKESRKLVHLSPDVVCLIQGRDHS